MAAVLLVTVVFARLAADSLQQALFDLPFDGPVRMLVLLALWSSIPALALICASLAHLGSILLLADAALAGTRPHTLRVLGLAVRRSASGLVVVLSVLVGVIPLFVLAVRWSLALPEVWVRGASPRAALRASWEATRGRAVPVAVALGGAIVAVAALGWAGSSLAESLPWQHSAVTAQVLISLVLGPIPAVVLTALWRDAVRVNHDRSLVAADPEVAAAARRYGTVVPTLVAVSLVATMLTPMSSAQAVPLPELAATDTSAATATVAPSYQGAMQGAAFLWERGDDNGQVRVFVESDGATAPNGTVALWVRGDDGPAELVGAPVVLAPLEGTTLSDATLDASSLGVGTYWLSVRYSGDEVHAPAVSTEQQVIMRAPWIQVDLTVDGPNDPVRVGDLMTVTAVVPDSGSLPPINGPFALVSAVDGSTIATGTFVGGRGVAQFRVSARGVQFVLEAPAIIDANLFSGENSVRAEQSPSTTTLSAQERAPFGSTVAVTAHVSGPGGLAGRGAARFETQVVGDVAVMELGTVTLDSSGVAATTFCVESPVDTAVCADAAVTVPASATAVRLRAVFLPSGDSESAPLSGSASPWVTIRLGTPPIDSTPPEVDDSAPLCRFVTFSNRPETDRFRPDPRAGSLGSPRVTTATNCTRFENGAVRQGHRDGTTLIVDARPAAGYEFVEWRFAGEAIATSQVLIWPLGPGLGELVPDVSLEPVYRPLCVPIPTVAVTGNASAVASVRAGTTMYSELFPFTDCVTRDGRQGAVEGAPIEVSASAAMNTDTGEPDIFYAARVGVRPQSVVDRVVTIGGVRTVRQVVTFAADRSISQVSVAYGPQCRTVDAPGLDILTGLNCDSPQGAGYVVGTPVEVEFDPETLAEFADFDGWTLDGEVDPALGSSYSTTVTVQSAPTTTVGYTTVGCFPVTASMEEAQSPRSTSFGSSVTVGPAPNCGPDRDRWREGTVITLIPTLGRGVEGEPTFAAWTDTVADASGVVTGARTVAAPPPGTTGLLEVDGQISATGWRMFTLEGPLVTVGSQFFEHACSTIRFERGDVAVDDVEIATDGCGPGRYVDPSKAAFFYSRGLDNSDRPLSREMFATDTGFFPETRLRFGVADSPVPLQGTAAMRQDSINVPRAWSWLSSAPLDCVGTECEVTVRGDVTVQLLQCQVINPTVNVRVVGDDSGVVYSAADFGLEEHAWVTSANMPCRDGVEQWRAESFVQLEPNMPASGFAFDSWGEVDGLSSTNVIERCDNPFGCTSDEIQTVPRASVRLSSDPAGHAVELNVTLTCSVPSLPAEVAIVTPAPNCPGASADNLLYVDGTILQLAAVETNRSGRTFVEFRGDLIPNTTGTIRAAASSFAHIDRSGALNWPERQATYYSVLAIVEPGTAVFGYYQFPNSTWDDIGDVAANVGKFTVGAVALTAAALTTLCAPCSGAIALLTVSEVLTRALGAGGVADVIAWFNPVYMAECITQWGFETLPPSTSRQATDLEGVRSGGAIVVGAGAAGVKTMFAKDPKMLSRLDTASSTAKQIGVVATVALGLYSNEVYNFTFTDANEADLRDTARFVSCVTNIYN